MFGLARLLAVATLVLIFVGGLVKSTETGLSDPTWPQFNGGYEPQLRGATRYEHAHRLIAGSVALLTIGIAIAARRREPRAYVRRLALVAAAAVLSQAVLGGLTVLFQLKSLGISLGHAGLAQIFLGLAVALATVTAPCWTGAGLPTVEPRGLRSLRLLSLLSLVAIYGQIILGAWVRYTPGAAFAIPDFPLSYGMLVPPLGEWNVRVQFIHRAGAAAVTVLVLATAGVALARHRAEPMLRRPAVALLGLLALQVLLGGLTIWTVKAVLPTTLHVVTGAGLLASALVLALRARLLLRDVPRAAPPSQLGRDLLTLTKVRIALLVLVATAAGYYLAAPGPIDAGRLALALLGTALLAAGSAALNQVIERGPDARMERTAGRPIPAGRISAGAALAFGLGLGAAGFAILYFGANATTAALGAATFVSYVAVYTPLKRFTWVATIVGAVPGALPPVMGWTAAGGALGPEAWSHFGILFVWQLPHVYAIAWLYREDYARGGFPMLPVLDPEGLATARQVAFCCLALLPLSLLPAAYGIAGRSYVVGALALSAAFLALGLALAARRSDACARRLFLGSVLYLPMLLALMTFDKRA